MKKIGVLTYYYNTTNYGGILQAYALCRAINSFGSEYSAEQICYDYDSAIIKKKSAFLAIKTLIKRFASFFFKKYKDYDSTKKQKNFKEFETSVPHSTDIYTRENIIMANDKYDYFIVGSDQVWNPISMDDNFFLSFVQGNKKKISYAASLGADFIEDDRIKLIREKISDFDCISLREKSGISLIGDIGKDIKWVSDPVFLLSKSEWEEIIKNVDIKKGKFLFSYFLSNNMNARKIVEEYAKKEQLTIVDFSPLQLINTNCIDCSSMGPLFFLKYLLNSRIVFTDSFHCTAFSVIFGVNFGVFKKKAQINISANDRIVDMLSDIGLEKHIINGEIHLLEMTNSCSKEHCDRKIMNYREEGITFLKSALD